MTTMYRVVAFVKDLNSNAPTKEEVINQIEMNKYPEFIDVLEVDETDIGEWHDEHELNKTMTTELALKYFPTHYHFIGDYSLKIEYNRVKNIMMGLIRENALQRDKMFELEKKINDYKKLEGIMKSIKELA